MFSLRQSLAAMARPQVQSDILVQNSSRLLITHDELLLFDAKKAREDNRTRRCINVPADDGLNL